MGGGNAAHSRAAILARPVPKATTPGSYAAARTHVPVGAASDVSRPAISPTTSSWVSAMSRISRPTSPVKCQGRRENVPAGRSKTVPLNATL